MIQNYSNILVMLLRLRQACDHPALVLRDRIWKKGDAVPTDLVAAMMCHLCHDVLSDEVCWFECAFYARVEATSFRRCVCMHAFMRVRACVVCAGMRVRIHL